MDDRIGQRLLRFLGALPELAHGPLEGEGGKAKAEVAEPSAAAPPEVPHRTSEETVVERYHANPFLAEAEPPPSAFASQLAEEVPPAHAEEPPPAIENQREKLERAPATEEKRDVEETHEPEHGRQEQQQESEDGAKVGAGWVLEERAQEETEASKGLRHAQAMGDEERCHGVVGDGTRCLRKPVEGKAYCREHSAGSSLDAISPVVRREKPEIQEAAGVEEMGFGEKIIE